MRKAWDSFRYAVIAAAGDGARSLTPRHSWVRTVQRALPGPLAAQTLAATQLSKYHTLRGHGFAAEDANHLADKLLGRMPRLTGILNAANGTDRIVKGVRIQSKYHRNPAETIAAAFDSATGAYRYTGQVLEVPRDQFKDSVRLMRHRIARGRVPGFDDPEAAEKIVRRGAITYEQAKNIARAATLDSLWFDAKTQALPSACSAGLSFAAAFAEGSRHGEDRKDAMWAVLRAALATGGTTLLSGVANAQVLRTKVVASGIVPARRCVRAVSRTLLGREAVTRIATGSLGRPAYGAAAANHVAKILRGSAVGATVSVSVTTVPDLYRAACAKSISWRQFIRNLSGNVGGTAGGNAGWLGGTATGGAIGTIVPGVGTAAGGMVGGLVGALGLGYAGSIALAAAAGKVMDIRDDLAILRWAETTSPHLGLH